MSDLNSDRKLEFKIEVENRELYINESKNLIKQQNKYKLKFEFGKKKDCRLRKIGTILFFMQTIHIRKRNLS